MKMLFLLLLSPLLFYEAQALTKEEKNHLSTHPYLLKREMVKGAPWPKVTILIPLKAKPEAAMALFSDFERQKDYVPGLLKSEVVAQPSPREVHTRYELKMPWPIANSHYVHGTHIEKVDHNKFTISWFVVESDSIEKIEGSATFEPYSEDKTLMIYESLIFPKSFVAPLFASTMVNDTKTSTLAIKEFIEREAQEKNESYERSLELLRASLNGQKVFDKKK